MISPTDRIPPQNEKTLVNNTRRKDFKAAADWQRKHEDLSCTHSVVVRRAAPHPRYGDKVPYFVEGTVQDIEQCSCEEAQKHRALKLARELHEN